LGQEKLDVILWSEDPAEFVGNSLNPAKIKSVEATGSREAKVLVADDQLSLAIGKGGQNVRLAAKLTGWKIDVRSQARPEEALEGGVADTAAAGEEGEESPPQATSVKPSRSMDSTSSPQVEEEEKPVYHKPEEEE
ncbi:MAG: hypothetical protein HYY99_01920, partial [Candidatus Colwellbacteria bacterium]|nr:hypothetical protein [Candidatus Colwellbacteria bacterium]